MRKYEMMLIAKQELEEDGMKSLIDEVSNLISREGGKVGGVDNWGLRHLEYPIKHEDNGRYAVINFEAEAEAVKELERVMKIKDEVLRAKIFVLEKEQ